MGSWSVYCEVSNIAITDMQKCCIIPLKQHSIESENYVPAAFPIFGEYDDYGRLENIVEDDNTKLIESHFGITIQEFATFLYDGKFTYDRDEAVGIAKKLEENGRLEEISEWRFMFVDKQVYDFASKEIKGYDAWYYNFDYKDVKDLRIKFDRYFDIGSDFVYFYDNAKENNSLLAYKYLRDIKNYEERFYELKRLKLSMYAMSKTWTPYSIYLTPQCGEREAHQTLLKEFDRINESYINTDDDDY